MLKLSLRDFASSCEGAFQQVVGHVGGCEKNVPPLPDKLVDAHDGINGDGGGAGDGVLPARHHKLGVAPSACNVGVDDDRTVAVSAGLVDLFGGLWSHRGEKVFIPTPLAQSPRDKATIEDGRDTFLTRGVVEEVSAVVNAKGKLVGIDLCVRIPSGVAQGNVVEVLALAAKVVEQLGDVPAPPGVVLLQAHWPSEFGVEVATVVGLDQAHEELHGENGKRVEPAIPAKRTVVHLQQEGVDAHRPIRVAHD
jgi:hypothetical protein